MRDTRHCDALEQSRDGIRVECGLLHLKAFSRKAHARQSITIIPERVRLANDALQFFCCPRVSVAETTTDDDVQELHEIEPR